MTTPHDSGRSVSTATPVLALVGATELVVERLRSAREQHLVHQAPTRALHRTAELAARAEGTYGELAARGGRLVQRLTAERATQDLLAQGRTTLSRGRAAVAIVRRVATGAAGVAEQQVAGPAAPAQTTTAQTTTGSGPASTSAPVARPPARKRTTSAVSGAPGSKTRARAQTKAASAPTESTAEVTRTIHEAAEKAGS